LTRPESSRVSAAALDQNERSCLFVETVRKGERTREAILERALTLASKIGLEGLTIGRLADELGLSKSGLFAHFKSKEALLVQMLERAAQRYSEVVVKPALDAPRGEPRIRVLFERYLCWPKLVPQPGGCIFISASTELDDQPGRARELLVRMRKEWLDFVAGAAQRAIDDGHFCAKIDPEQFAFQMEGIGLMWHHASRLLRDPRADERARRAFEDLLASARASRR
jgi:AcrR family transcriptional regulator